MQAHDELENGLLSLVAKTDLEMAPQFREERHWSSCSDVVVQILKGKKQNLGALEMSNPYTSAVPFVAVVVDFLDPFSC